MKEKLEKAVPHVAVSVALLVAASICGHFLPDDGMRFLPFFIAGTCEKWSANKFKEWQDKRKAK